LQLHELRLTEGSPTGTAVKEDDCTTTGACLVQVDGFAVLVW
jgi:hypothetical protein